jgi:hypothetical protein
VCVLRKNWTYKKGIVFTLLTIKKLLEWVLTPSLLTPHFFQVGKETLRIWSLFAKAIATHSG